MDGKQYVSVLAGYGGAGADGSTNDKIAWPYHAPRRLLTFSLDGKASLPAMMTDAGVTTAQIIDDPELQLDSRRIASGEYLWNFSCVTCHGPDARSLGAAPDLRSSTLAADRVAFKRVLTQNLLVAKGMPRFDDLKNDDVEALYQYIRSAARKSKKQSVVH